MRININFDCPYCGNIVVAHRITAGVWISDCYDCGHHTKEHLHAVGKCQNCSKLVGDEVVVSSDYDIGEEPIQMGLLITNVAGDVKPYYLNEKVD